MDIAASSPHGAFSGAIRPELPVSASVSRWSNSDPRSGTGGHRLCLPLLLAFWWCSGSTQLTEWKSRSLRRGSALSSTSVPLQSFPAVGVSGGHLPHSTQAHSRSDSHHDDEGPNQYVAMGRLWASHQLAAVPETLIYRGPTHRCHSMGEDGPPTQ